MLRDLRFAGQALWRTPVFTISAIVALGLALGANATIFGLVDGLWLRPAAIADPGSIARVFAVTSTTTTGGWSYPEYLRVRAAVPAFADVALRGRRGALLDTAGGPPQMLLVNVVSTNFFSMLGVAASAGRVFGPGDDAALEQAPAVVLGHDCWIRVFGGDAAIVGQSIRLAGRQPLQVRVLGVLPAGFRELDPAADRDLWMPPQTWERYASRAEFTARQERWFDMVARLRPQTPVRVAQAQVQAAAAALAADYPDTNAGRGARVLTDAAWRYENGGASAEALLGLVVLVVLITCVNVANLLLARTAARAREVAVRVAVGASRLQLVRHLMAESLLLGAGGALLGVLVAGWLLVAVPLLLIAPPGFRAFEVFRVDARLMMFTAATALLTTLLFGIVPSVIGTRADLAPLMKGADPLGRAGSRSHAVRQTFVIAQVAISLVLLAAAGLLARSFRHVQHADIGVTRSAVLTAWISGTEIAKADVEQALQAIHGMGGVTNVAVAFRAPLSLSGGGLAMPMAIPDRPPAPEQGLPQVKFNPVSTGYFQTLGIARLRGRLFTEADERPGEPVIVVNEAFERQFFPGRSALDASVRPGGPDAPLHRIVGIVHDAVINDIAEPSEPYFYLPFWRRPSGEITILVQTSGDPAALAPAVKATLKRVNPALEPTRIATMGEYIAYSGSLFRATASLAALLAAIGLALTALGVYGVVAYRTARRRSEFGIRLAIGASPRDILTLVMGEGIRVALGGIAIGLPVALGATRLLASLLFRTKPFEASAFALACGVLIAAVLAATAIPAWRASRVAPSRALRDF